MFDIFAWKKLTQLNWTINCLVADNWFFFEWKLSWLFSSLCLWEGEKSISTFFLKFIDWVLFERVRKSSWIWLFMYTVAYVRVCVRARAYALYEHSGTSTNNTLPEHRAVKIWIREKEIVCWNCSVAIMSHFGKNSREETHQEGSNAWTERE